LRKLLVPATALPLPLASSSPAIPKPGKKKKMTNIEKRDKKLQLKEMEEEKGYVPPI